MAGLLYLVTSIPIATAGPFDLDWTLYPCEGGASPDGCGDSTFNNRSGLRNAPANIGGIPFRQTQFRVDGVWYREYTMGAPGDPFAQNIIIEVRQAPGLTSNGGRGFSASAGLTGEEGNGPCGPAGLSANCKVVQMGNGEDPLGLIYKHDAVTSGTGTAHPRRVIVNQIINEGGYSQQFLKDQFDKKPMITASMIDDDIEVFVRIDMRGLDYSQMDTAAPMSNTLWLSDSSSPSGYFDAGSFTFFDDPFDPGDDNFQQPQNLNVTAGRFVYIEGGPGDTGLEGQYFYSDGGGYNLYAISGAEFRDDAQNGGPFADGIVYPEVTLDPVFSFYPDLID